MKQIAYQTDGFLIYSYDYIILWPGYKNTADIFIYVVIILTIFIRVLTMWDYYEHLWP